jgi:hypothetical protein
VPFGCIFESNPTCSGHRLCPSHPNSSLIKYQVQLACISKKGYVLVRLSRICASVVSKSVFVCGSTTLSMKEEDEKKLDGMMHALRSMGDGARCGLQRGERECERPSGTPPFEFHPQPRCGSSQMEEVNCGQHVTWFLRPDKISTRSEIAKRTSPITHART